MTTVPSGHVVVAGGGGGGGGHGTSAEITDPSGQVCVAGARGAVAHAESAIVATTARAIRLIFVSSFLFRKRNQ
jgi:hypothetical protein